MPCGTGAHILIWLGIASIVTILFLTIKIPDISTLNKESVNQWVQELADTGKLNGQIYITYDGKILANRVAEANDSSNKPTLDSRFNLASASKQFTAYGIMLLINDGRLSLNTKVSEIIPELTHFEKVSVGELLNHTSGVPDYFSILETSNDQSLITNSSVISALTPLDFKKSNRFKYSNTGYVILAQIIEKISGDRFSEFMKDRIFSPLGKTSTEVLTKSTKAIQSYGKGLLLFGREKRIKDSPFDGVVGDGGIVSNTSDLSLWYENLQKGNLISKENFWQFIDMNKTTEPPYYSFGWFVNGKTIQHSGGWNGYSSYLYFNFEKNSNFIILDNSNNFIRVTNQGFDLNSIPNRLIRKIEHN